MLLKSRWEWWVKRKASKGNTHRAIKCDVSLHWLLLHGKFWRDTSGQLTGMFAWLVLHIRTTRWEVDERGKERGFICLVPSRLLFPSGQVSLHSRYLSWTFWLIHLASWWMLWETDPTPVHYFTQIQSRRGSCVDDSVWRIPAMELILGSIVDYSWLAHLRNGDSASRAVVLEVSGKFWKKKTVDVTWGGAFVSSTLITLIRFSGQLSLLSSTTIISNFI